MDIPDVRYARTGCVAIAYQSAGDGPPVVYAPHLCTIDALWRAPHSRAFLDRLTDDVHLIVFNPRGTGLSDRPRHVTLESRMDDIAAVVDAENLDPITLLGVSESANACALFAATFPERCRNLILFTPYASVEMDEHERADWIRSMREHWGERAWMEEFATGINPGYARDPATMEWFVWMQRAAASPSAAAAFATLQMDTDITDVLPSIRVPTVIAYRAEDQASALEVARLIPDSTVVEFGGSGIDPYGMPGDEHGELAELTVATAMGDPTPEIPDSVLATLLFTDLTDSTVMAAELGDVEWRRTLTEHHAEVRRELSRFRGTEVDTAGDGFFCRFDGPARAIGYAHAIVEAGRTRGLVVRAGVHTGECAVMGSRLAGISVHIGARVLGQARPGEVLVSRTVKDLVAGSGIGFDDRGDHALKGVPGTWQLYAAMP